MKVPIFEDPWILGLGIVILTIISFYWENFICFFGILYSLEISIFVIFELLFQILSI